MVHFLVMGTYVPGSLHTAKPGAILRLRNLSRLQLCFLLFTNVSKIIKDKGRH